MKPTAPQGRFLKQWRGHLVEVGEKGLKVDGRTIDPAPLTERDAVRPQDDVHTHPSLQFLEGGALVYRGHVQAEVHSDQVTVHGPEGAQWPPASLRPSPSPVVPPPAAALEPEDVEPDELDLFPDDLDDEEIDL
ncbi:hypothetical protein [Streptomyces sp. BH105]|uniref:hypothetical protein n=1 Tax=Streptomyces sp. BH105 TaxID=3410408 RepID=UPI003CF48A05